MSSPAPTLARASSASLRPRLRAFRDDEPAAAMLSATNLVKTYRKNRLQIPVLKGVDFAAPEGQITAIIGQSGSGKSTLLHLLGTLDRPDEGEIHFEGQRIDNLPRGDRDRFRNRSLGMIFQFYHLLPELTTLENVLAPCMIGQSFFGYLRHGRQLRKQAKEWLEVVGLGHRLNHRPNELSGGEMQRTAIARALVTKPRILLADEPTGNLDQETGSGILEILQRINREERLTMVLVTHDESIARGCDQVVRLAQGRVEAA